MHIERKVLLRAVFIACIVGPVLIVINQVSDVMAGAGLSYAKAILTMMVPFVVSVVSSLLTSGKASPAPRGGDEAGHLLPQILTNAQKVNNASSARHEEIEALIVTAQQLRASLSGQGLDQSHKPVEELLVKLDGIRNQTDAALEGSAANIQLAQSGMSALGRPANT